MCNSKDLNFTPEEEEYYNNMYLDLIKKPFRERITEAKETMFSCKFRKSFLEKVASLYRILLPEIYGWEMNRKVRIWYSEWKEDYISKKN